MSKTDQELELADSFFALIKKEEAKEELGADLITLIRALKDGIWDSKVGMKVPNPYLAYNVRSGEFLLVDDGHNLDLLRTYPLKDQGKTWVLTREELDEELCEGL